MACWSEVLLVVDVMLLATVNKVLDVKNNIKLLLNSNLII